MEALMAHYKPVNLRTVDHYKHVQIFNMEKYQYKLFLAIISPWIYIPSLE